MRAATMRLAFTTAILMPLLGGRALAAEPRNYAYFFLQGKVSAAGGAREGVAGVTVRVAGADSRSFEVLTDRDGVFRFERLPLQRYQLTVSDAAGKVVRSFEQEIEPGASSRHRLTIRMGRGQPASTAVHAAGPEELEVAFTQRAPRWKRFWGQFGIFLGAAIVLAL